MDSYERSFFRSLQPEEGFIILWWYTSIVQSTPAVSMRPVLRLSTIMSWLASLPLLYRWLDEFYMKCKGLSNAMWKFIAAMKKYGSNLLNINAYGINSAQQLRLCCGCSRFLEIFKALTTEMGDMWEYTWKMWRISQLHHPGVLERCPLSDRPLLGVYSSALLTLS